jgi:hypothetical protein
MTGHDQAWADEHVAEADALDQAELTSGVSVGVRRQLPRRYRERLLRAAACEILGHVAA